MLLRSLQWDPVDCVTMSVIAAWCLILETLLRFNGRSMQQLLRGRLGLLHGLWLALLPAGLQFLLKGLVHTSAFIK